MKHLNVSYRQKQALTRDEWLEATRKLDGVKQVEGGFSTRNPVTGEVISMPGGPGDVAVRNAEMEWVPCFRFSQNSASFNATSDIDPPNDPARILATRLAAALGAQIVGDEGESYDGKR